MPSLSLVTFKNRWVRNKITILQGGGLQLVDISSSDDKEEKKQPIRRKLCRWCLPVGVRVAVHEPAAVVVNVHGPSLVVLAQHHVLDDVNPGDAKGWIRMVVVAVHVQFPVMHALGEGGCAQNNPVIVAAAGGRLVVVWQHDVPVSWGGVEGEPRHCAGEKEMQVCDRIGCTHPSDALLPLGERGSAFLKTPPHSQVTRMIFPHYPRGYTGLLCTETQLGVTARDWVRKKRVLHAICITQEDLKGIFQFRQLKGAMEV